MTTSRPHHKQRQLLLVLLLFLVGQLTFTLHSHDLSLHVTDSEECVVCLISTSGDPAPVTNIPKIQFTVENSQHLPVQNVLAPQSTQTSAQPRAPPVS